MSMSWGSQGGSVPLTEMGETGRAIEQVLSVFPNVAFETVCSAVAQAASLVGENAYDVLLDQAVEILLANVDSSTEGLSHSTDKPHHPNDMSEGTPSDSCPSALNPDQSSCDNVAAPLQKMFSMEEAQSTSSLLDYETMLPSATHKEFQDCSDLHDTKNEEMDSVDTKEQNTAELCVEQGTSKMICSNLMYAGKKADSMWTNFGSSSDEDDGIDCDSHINSDSNLVCGKNLIGQADDIQMMFEGDEVSRDKGTVSLSRNLEGDGLGSTINVRNYRKPDSKHTVKTEFDDKFAVRTGSDATRGDDFVYDTAIAKTSGSVTNARRTRESIDDDMLSKVTRNRKQANEKVDSSVLDGIELSEPIKGEKHNPQAKLGNIMGKNIPVKISVNKSAASSSQSMWDSDNSDALDLISDHDISNGASVEIGKETVKADNKVTDIAMATCSSADDAQSSRQNDDDWPILRTCRRYSKPKSSKFHSIFKDESNIIDLVSGDDMDIDQLGTRSNVDMKTDVRVPKKDIPLSFASTTPSITNPKPVTIKLEPGQGLIDSFHYTDPDSSRGILSDRAADACCNINTALQGSLTSANIASSLAMDTVMVKSEPSRSHPARVKLESKTGLVLKKLPQELCKNQATVSSQSDLIDSIQCDGEYANSNTISQYSLPDSSTESKIQISLPSDPTTVYHSAFLSTASSSVVDHSTDVSPLPSFTRISSGSNISCSKGETVTKVTNLPSEQTLQDSAVEMLNSNTVSTADPIVACTQSAHFPSQKQITSSISSTDSLSLPQHSDITVRTGQQTVAALCHDIMKSDTKPSSLSQASDSKGMAAIFLDISDVSKYGNVISQPALSASVPVTSVTNTSSGPGQLHDAATNDARVNSLILDSVSNDINFNPLNSASSGADATPVTTSQEALKMEPKVGQSSPIIARKGDAGQNAVGYHQTASPKHFRSLLNGLVHHFPKPAGVSGHHVNDISSQLLSSLRMVTNQKSANTAVSQRAESTSKSAMETGNSVDSVTTSIPSVMMAGASRIQVPVVPGNVTPNKRTGQNLHKHLQTKKMKWDDGAASTSYRDPGRMSGMDSDDDDDTRPSTSGTFHVSWDLPKVVETDESDGLDALAFDLPRPNDGSIMMCEACETSSLLSKSTQCSNCHIVCVTCVEEEIRRTMASEKMNLSCPVKSCQDIIGLGAVSTILTPLVLDLLRENIRQKEEKASLSAINQMQGIVRCPNCKCSGFLDDDSPYFHCSNCSMKCCRYCKAAWLKGKEHDGCSLLSFVGTSCLNDSSKLPANWTSPTNPSTSAEMVYTWELVPLTSMEGASVSSFYRRTSQSNIVAIHRIQNRRLWEKYVLKRKHMVEEIGEANIREKYFFHGTRAETRENICREGFDVRIRTVNGAAYGKGIYFSTKAAYSEKYAVGSNVLFLSRVLCGWSTQGERQLTRPPYDPQTQRMFDSCCDRLPKPTMYIVFDNSQCYPEYAITYS